MPKTKLVGAWTKSVLFDAERNYGTVQCLRFGDACQYILAHGYNGRTGAGQQRALVQSHVKKLQQEMRGGTFTPTPVSAALEKRHRAGLVADPATGTFELEVDSQDPLLHTDGGHRFEALSRFAKSLKVDAEKARAAGDAAELERAERWLAQVENLPVTVTVYFDGDPARDFVNLQAGRPVDASHIHSLALQAGINKDPVAKMAHAIARALDKTPCSPFQKIIKFDSRANLPVPISTLTARGSSDAATSLFGTARLGLAFDRGVEFLAQTLVDGFEALELDDEAVTAAKGSGLLQADKPLTTVANGGTKGACTMHVGVGLCLAYRLIALKKDAADESDLKALVDAARETLDKPVGGNMSGPAKRALIGSFARALFADLKVDKHAGIPVALLKALSPSAFGAPKLPKEPKPPSQRSRRLPDLKGPITVTTEPVTVPAVIDEPAVVTGALVPTPIEDDEDYEPAPWDKELDEVAA